MNLREQLSPAIAGSDTCYCRNPGRRFAALACPGL